ncbi:MAG TPA: hypothetical protein PK020_17245 [Ilumatobacteraceae bacterium]|nr:hypothetical protein [Ilumatobacteraceae bacterium]HRB03096.1 hypothetical protein [Ilumatobacteraceae bacterium]
MSHRPTPCALCFLLGEDSNVDTAAEAFTPGEHDSFVVQLGRPKQHVVLVCGQYLSRPCAPRARFACQPSPGGTTRAAAQILHSGPELWALDTTRQTKATEGEHAGVERAEQLGQVVAAVAARPDVA